jgi:hypothetical protein
MRARVELLDSLHPRVRDYIETASSGVRKKRREEIQIELASHALEMQDELSRESLSVDQIAEKIRTRLGDVVALENQLALVNRTPIQKWILRGLVLTIIFGSTFVVAWTLWTADYIRKVALVENSDFNRIRNQILADQQEFSHEPFIQQKFQGKDVGELFNSEEFTKKIESEFPTRISWKGDFKTIYEKFDFSTLSQFDPTWMKNLDEYSHWDLFSSGPAGESLKKGKWVYNWPSVVYLFTTAHARLLQGFKVNDAENALKETYHLGRLVYSNHTGIANDIGLAILGDVIRAYQYGLENKLVHKMEIFERYPDETRYRLRRVSRTTFEILTHPLISADQIRVFGKADLHLGLCAGLAEYLVSAEVLRPTPTLKLFSFENYISERFTEMDRLAETNMEKCHLGNFKRAGEQAWANIKSGPNDSTFFQYKMAKMIPVVGPLVEIQMARFMAGWDDRKLSNLYDEKIDLKN